nr:phosphomannomutase/phosphoglucomutase [Gammaproteobacteria bacterium]
MQQTSTKKYQIVKNISSHLFRAYDIRGIVKPNYFDENSIYTIALAIGTKIKASKQDSIVIARDGRLSANRLNLALIQGLLDTGLAVIDIGPNPTPGLYFSIQHLKQQTGVI